MASVRAADVGASSLLQFAHIIEPTDDRGLLTAEKAMELGLSAAELQQIYGAMGVIRCLFSDDPNGAWIVSASLIGSTEKITTSLHVFAVPSLNLLSCKFRSFSQFQWQRLEFGTKDLARVRSYNSGNFDDKIVIALDGTVSNSKSFPVLSNSHLFKLVQAEHYKATAKDFRSLPLTEVIALSSGEEEFPNLGYDARWGIPIAQKCKLKFWTLH